MILIYARVGRQAVMDGKSFAATAWFVSGYLLGWIAFSVAATSAQWALERASLLTPNDGQYERHPWRRCVDHRRPLSVDAA
jgi:predicted metal-binding membrane protein